MPADISYPHTSVPAVDVTAASSRLPLGVGLVVAAFASVGLWVGIGAGVKALFF